MIQCQAISNRDTADLFVRHPKSYLRETRFLLRDSRTTPETPIIAKDQLVKMASSISAIKKTPATAKIKRKIITPSGITTLRLGCGFDLHESATVDRDSFRSKNPLTVFANRFVESTATT